MAITSFRRRRSLPLWGLLAVCAPVAAAGQVLTAIEFSFSNPGARSMGFGGAFVALADDATAAFANPAGLVQLSRPEISVEGRFWSYSSPYTAGGRAAGTPTGLGIDTVDEPTQAISEVDLSGLSFLSVVYPLEHWTFAFYHHQLQQFELTQEIQGIFTPGPVAGAWRGPIERGHFGFDVTANALAVGLRAGERLNLGVGVSEFQPTSYILGSEFRPDADTLEAYFAEASFLPERRTHFIRAESGGADWGLSLGFLYVLTPNWRLGGVFREGPELDFSLAGFAGPAHPELPAGSRLGEDSTPWVLPDVYGLGIAYRSANGRWTGAFEWSRVEYSTVVEQLADNFRNPTESLDDADELHLGGEYAFFLGRSVMAVRFGVWHDPDHQPRDEANFGIYRAENPGGEDQLHVAAGLGAAFDSLQIDLAIDLSALRDTASVSLIYSF